jgi:6-phosphogluconolactonase
LVGGLRPEVSVFPDLEGAATALAARVVEVARGSVNRGGRFSIAISGGKSPVPLFDLLGGEFRSRLPWPRTHVFWVDERAVPPDDARSNYGLALRTLLRSTPLEPDHVHRIHAEADPLKAAADAYERELREYFGPELAVKSGTFDLVLLGMGAEGHTASLFPGSPALEERDRWVDPVPAPPAEPPVPRVTLTLPALNRAREVDFLVAGADKAVAVRSVLASGPGDPTGLPAARVCPSFRLGWYLDRAAAAGTPPTA